MCGGTANSEDDRQGKEKLVILSNCPALAKSQIECYSLLAKTDVHHYPGNNIDLGTAARNTKVHTLAGTQVMCDL